MNERICEQEYKHLLGCGNYFELGRMDAANTLKTM
jgi:hypothetical protein